MNAEEFRALLANTIGERSGALEFRSSGAHYYLLIPPNILVLNKRSYRGSFEGLFVAVTHDFFSNTKDAKGKFKLPSYPSDFPIYADLEIVSKQYRLHKHPSEFEYDLNASTREGTGRSSQEQFKNASNLAQMIDDADATKQYIETTVDLLVSVGMRLGHECTPLTTFKVLTRYSKALIMPCWTVFPDLVRYLKVHNIEVPLESCGAAPADVAANLDNLTKVSCQSDPETAELISKLARKIRAL
jgi:hypothetical protein